jgi:hypothetical protein
VHPASESTQQEKHTTFATGAKRCENVAGQTSPFPMRYDLLFSNTDFLKRMAATYGEGGAKYGDDNWRNGMPEKSIFNHALAHLVQHLEGDTTEDHLAHATWNLITLMWVQVNKPELMDLTALTAKGKLQPCNSTPMVHQTPDQGEGGVAPIEETSDEPEPNLQYRSIQVAMARELRNARLVDQNEHLLIIRALSGAKLTNGEYRKLVAIYISRR